MNLALLLLIAVVGTVWAAENCCIKSISDPSQAQSCVEERVPIAPSTTSKIRLITFADDKVKNYAQYSTVINKVYAAKNNYQYLDLSSSVTGEPGDARWTKVRCLNDTMSKFTDGYVVWLDADLIFLDMDFKLEPIIEAHPDASLIACADGIQSSTALNGGALIFKINEWTSNFLNEWWGDDITHDFMVLKFTNLLGDQNRLDELFLHHKHTGKIVVMPPDAFNSDPPAWIRQKSDTPVLHLMGEIPEVRVQSFRKAFSSVCETLQNAGTTLDKLKFPKQLAVSRETLIQIAQSEYEIHVNKTVKKFQHKLKLKKEVKADHIHRMDLAMQKLCQALEFESISCAHIRDLNYDTFKNYLDKFRSRNEQKMSENQGVGLDSWPEALMTTVHAGQRIVEYSTDAARRLDVGNELLSFLDELGIIIEKNHPLQYTLAVNNVMRSLSSLFVERQNFKGAFMFLNKSIEVCQKHVNVVGLSPIVENILMISDIYLKLGEYQTSLDYINGVALYIDNNDGKTEMGDEFNYEVYKNSRANIYSELRAKILLANASLQVVYEKYPEAETNLRDLNALLAETSDASLLKNINFYVSQSEALERRMLEQNQEGNAMSSGEGSNEKRRVHMEF